MRNAYRVLAMLIAAGVVVQAATIAYAMFQVLHSTDNGGVFDENTADNAGQLVHGVIGSSVIPFIALVLLILSFFAKIPGGVKWAAITFGLVALQIVLAVFAKGLPLIGILHGLNAFALAGVASIAGRQARLADTAAPAARDTTAPAL